VYRFWRCGVVTTAALVVGCGLSALCSPSALAASSAPTGGSGSYVLTAHDPGSGYAPTFTGNGELGVAVRCQPAVASSSQVGADPLAAVDGSPATDWQPASLPATLTAPVQGGSQVLRMAQLVWGQQWPPPPGPNIPPPTGPVVTLRPSAYRVQVSTDGQNWTTVATVTNGSGTTDTVHFRPTAASFVRVAVDSSATSQPPMLEELTATG
jgi:hypothetical protein